MKDLFKVIRDVELYSHSVIATILEDGAATKTLFSGPEIVVCGGNLKFMKEHQAEIVNVRKTGIYGFGGKEVYCEVVETVPDLIVCGAGHVGLACIKAGKMIEMNVTCYEDRDEFADLAEEAGADKVIRGEVAKNLEDLEAGENTFIVTMMRAHALDEANLEKLLPLDAAYIGMLGSPKKVNAIKGRLDEKGFDLTLFDRLHTPIGLDIAAQTPEEIGIAIIGEIIKCKNEGKDHSKAFTDEQFSAIIDDKEPAVLCTLVRKYEASPREPGTKMVVKAGGEKIGTIGGGLAEAETIKFAQKFLEDDSFKTAVRKVGEGKITAVNSGMLCGGIVDILFERV